MILNKIAFQVTEPTTDVLWLQPIKQGCVLRVFNHGRWQTLIPVDDHGTPSIDDDTPWSGGGKVGPDTVGSTEIIDGSVRTVDLNREITDKLDDTYVEDNESLYINGTKPE